MGYLSPSELASETDCRKSGSFRIWAFQCTVFHSLTHKIAKYVKVLAFKNESWLNCYRKYDKIVLNSSRRAILPLEVHQLILALVSKCVR